jgi:hypothetical protein
MSSSNDFNTLELLDDIENLLFLCDRLNNRLIQVTSYVDEVKQTWVSKRRSIEFDSNISPIIAQKAIKCNKVLLNVAEKLAVVELQTESLHNLHSSIPNLLTIHNEKHPICPPTPVINHTSGGKTEPIGNGLRSREILPTATRSLNVGTNTFTARNTSTLFSETVSVKTPIDQQQQSAFQRPVSVKDNLGLQQTKLSPLTSSKILPNGSVNGHPSDSYSCMFTSSFSISSLNLILAAKMNEPIVPDNKIRVKMQVISSGTIWRNADIPIVDHPSAFFVSNQDPRVTEQFNMMSIEMK